MDSTLEKKIENKYLTLFKDIKVNYKGNLLYRSSSNKSLSVNPIVWELIRDANGTTPLSVICNKFKEKYETDEKEFYTFILSLADKKIISLTDNESPAPIVTVTGNYPEMLSLILTNRCNLNCYYCYGNYNPFNSEFVPFEKVKELFSQLESIGVRGIELTGGEPLVHPHFKEILVEACKIFGHVSILTNGSLFSDEIYEVIERYKNKIGVRISVDGMSDATNDKIRQAKHTKKRTFAAIGRLKSMGVNVGVTYMLVYDNRLEVDDFCAYMEKTGIKNIMISAPEKIRQHLTVTFPDGKLITDRTSLYYQELAEIHAAVSEKYKSIMRYHLERKKRKMELLPNCGAGWKNISIRPGGDVQACQLLTNSVVMGNVFKQPVKEIFGDNDLTNFFSNIRFTPDKTKACSECGDLEFCGKCITKIMIANKKRIVSGLGLCETAKNNRLTVHIIDKYLNYEEQ